MCWCLVSFERSRRDLESTIDELQRQVDNISERSLQNENKLKLALHSEKLSHDADIQRLTADKVININNNNNNNNTTIYKAL